MKTVFAKTEREWAERAARHLKAELKRADVTYEELAETSQNTRICRDQGQHCEQSSSGDDECAFFFGKPSYDRPRGRKVGGNLTH